MRIINVTGHSGSGKTTFIRQLIPELTRTGLTATIKHLGHHTFALAPGKDTTLFYESGASISTGIDDEKTVYVSNSPDLVKSLDYLCDQGIEYTVIEGFKTLDLPSVVIGDLSAVHCLYRNPDPVAISQDTSVFPEYHTEKSLEREVSGRWNKKNPDLTSDQVIAVTVCTTVAVAGVEGLFPDMVLPAIARDVSDELSNADRNAVTGISFRPWWLFKDRQELYISSVTSGHAYGFNQITRGIDLLKERCGEKGITISIKGW